MNMLAIKTFSALVFVYLATASPNQRPELTRCPGTSVSPVQIDSVILKNVQIGKTAEIIAKVHVNESTGNHLVVQTSFNDAKGRPLPCVHAIVPAEMKLCDGTTEKEKQISLDWNNKCPVKAGEHIARLSVYLPDVAPVRLCLMDGQLTATLKIQDDGETLDCVFYPISIDLN